MTVEAAPGSSFEVASLEVTARLEQPDGSPAKSETATLPGGGGSVSLPADLVVMLGDADGRLLVSAVARDDGGGAVASGSAAGTVPSGGSGQVAALTVMLVHGTDAGCRDGLAVRGEICYGPSFVVIDGRAGGAAAIDVDGDGVRDLVAGVTLRQADGERALSIMRGRGGDRFDLPATLRGPAIGAPEDASVTTGDLDGDGVVDLAVGGSYDDPPLLSRGSAAGLTPLQSLSGSAGGQDPRIVDLDADGNLDLVSHAGHFVDAFLGDGDGALGHAGDISFDAETYVLDAGELDDRPGADVVVSSIDFQGRPQHLTLLGWQDGAFVERAGREDLPSPSDIAVAELDGSAPAEIVTIDDEALRVHYVDGSEIASEPQVVVAPSPDSDALEALDSLTAVRRVGHADDVAVTLSGWGDPREIVTLVVLRPSDGTRTLVELGRMNLRCTRAYLHADDVDGDGAQEILVACGEYSGFEREGVVVVHVEDDGPWAPERAGGTGITIDVGDVDADARPDLAWVEGARMYVRLGADAPATAQVVEVGRTNGDLQRPTFADLDGDGQDEVAALCPSCRDDFGAVVRWTRTQIGWEAESLAIEGLDPNDSSHPRRPVALAVARLAPEGPLRLVVGLREGTVGVWAEEGFVEAAGALELDGGSDVRLAVGAIDDEAGDDVVGTWAEAEAVVLFHGDGEGGLQDGERIAGLIGDGEPGPIAVGDVDGDGADEIVVTRRYGGDVQVFGWRDGALEGLAGFPTDMSIYSASVLDLDGDAASELVLAGEPRIAILTLGPDGPVPRMSLPGSRGFYDGFRVWPREAPDPWEPPTLWTAARTEAGTTDFVPQSLIFRPRP